MTETPYDDHVTVETLPDREIVRYPSLEPAFYVVMTDGRPYLPGEQNSPTLGSVEEARAWRPVNPRDRAGRRRRRWACPGCGVTASPRGAWSWKHADDGSALCPSEAPDRASYEPVWR